MFFEATEKINSKKISHTIHNSDFLKESKQIEENTIDLVITSPPYNAGHNYDNYNDNISNADYIAWLKKVAEKIYRIAKPGGRVCINVPFAIKNKITKDVNFLATKICDCFNSVGFLDFEMITWHKGKNINHFQGNNTAWGSWKSPSSPSFRPLGEVILVFCKESRRHIGEKANIDISADEFKEWTKNIWYLDESNLRINNMLCVPNEKKYAHPAPYPSALIERLVKLYSYRGDLILDPFNGTGTTSLVAEKLGREFVGFELSPVYCEIAEQRIKNWREQEQSQEHVMPINSDKNFAILINQDDSAGTINEIFRYKESFSPNLLSHLKKKFAIKNTENILEPFLGTGSAFLGNEEIKKIAGFETNPFAFDVARAKLAKVDFPNDIEKLISSLIKKIKTPQEFAFPKWQSYARYVDVGTFNKVKTLLTAIEKEKNIVDKNLRHYFRMVVLANLESVFKYKRDGNGIKFRQAKINYDGLEEFYQKLFSKAIQLKNQHENKFTESLLFNSSCMEMDEVADNKYDIILTSPPYANSFDYFEVYKMELWTGEYVHSAQELRKLRKTALRNNGNSNINIETIENEILQMSLAKLQNKKTTQMLRNYFFDMQCVIANCYKKLKFDAMAFIVVGNSFYEGVPIATDTILATIANQVGFNVEEIIKARELKTSPQQMKILKPQDRKYLRESIICLKKS